MEILRQRAQLFRALREFFFQKNVLEVDTPILSQFGNTDPHIESFIASPNVPECSSAPLYLQTSPEFAMKRLLAANSGSIYQMCKVFRHDEYGRHHNLEFTMLEWYRLDFSYHDLMDEVAELISVVFAELSGQPQTLPFEKITYHQAFLTTTGLDISCASTEELSDFVLSRQDSVTGIEHGNREVWLDLIMGQYVQPQLGRKKLTFMFDFPENKAALANIRSGSPPLAERFELFIEGIELANGYQELLEPEKILQRFKAEQKIRFNSKQLPVKHDKYLIQACEHGLPTCAGVAMGIDRLILVITSQESLKKVLAFCSRNA